MALIPTRKPYSEVIPVPLGAQRWGPARPCTKFASPGPAPPAVGGPVAGAGTGPVGPLRTLVLMMTVAVAVMKMLSGDANDGDFCHILQRFAKEPLW